MVIPPTLIADCLLSSCLSFNPNSFKSLTSWHRPLPIAAGNTAVGKVARCIGGTRPLSQLRCLFEACQLPRQTLVVQSGLLNL